MRANDSNSNNKSSGIGTVLLGMAALALACMVGTIGLLQQVGELGPKIGDIVAFDPGDSMSRDMKAQVTATTADNRRGGFCILDVRIMHTNGGSLVIESRQPQTQSGFRVHWAGGASSADGTDCGASTDLLLNQDDIEVLAMAAGGFGVPARKLAHNSLWSSPAVVQ